MEWRRIITINFIFNNCADSNAFVEIKTEALKPMRACVKDSQLNGKLDDP